MASCCCRASTGVTAVRRAVSAARRAQSCSCFVWRGWLPLPRRSRYVGTMAAPTALVGSFAGPEDAPQRLLPAKRLEAVLPGLESAARAAAARPHEEAMDDAAE
jgi:hypothetical protein